MARPRASLEQRQQQRDRIRHAAAEVYREEGLTGVTVRAISDRAGVSTGTLYSYFTNLEELMQSLWIEPVAEANRRLEAIVADNPDPIDRIRALLEAYARFADDEPEVFRGAVLFVRPASVSKPPVEPVDELPFYRMLKTAIEDGQAVGGVGLGDPDTMAQVLWAGVHGALALPVNIDRFSVRPSAVLVPVMIDALIANVAGSAHVSSGSEAE